MTKHPKRPRDPAQLAKLVVDLATMDDAEREALKAKMKPPRAKPSAVKRPTKAERS